MKISPTSAIAIALACLLSSASCSGGSETTTAKSPDEIKKEYLNRAERMQQDNAKK